MEGAVVLATLLVIAASSTHVYRRSLSAQDALEHQNDFYLPRSVVPRSYRLRLTPDLELGTFTGEVSVNVSCLEAVDSLTLHAHRSLNTTSAGLRVRRLPADPASDESQEVVVSSTKKNFAKQWYIIMLAEQLQKGADYELHISFSGNLNDNKSEVFFRGFYVDNRSQDKSWYAATAMGTTKARQVFPCFDEPSLKATFQISVGARRKYHVWSNMPLKDTEDMAENPGWLWHHFPPTPLMSTFSVGVFVSDFHYATTMLPTGGYIRLSSRPELLDKLEKVNQLSAEAFNFAEEYLNFTYPLEKLDVILLPASSSDYAADGWGIVMIRETDIFNSQNMRTAVVGSVLTQWLGHLTTPYWWSSICIYSALLNHLVLQFTTQKLHMPADTTLYAMLQHSYSRHEEQSSSITGDEYTVLRLLRLLNYTLTEDTFRQGVRIFLEDRQYKTFTEGNVWTSLTTQAVTDNTLEEGMTVEEVAKSWLGKARYPVVNVTRHYNNNTATVQQHVFLRERPHNLAGKERMLWYIPVMYISPDNMAVSEVRPVVWLKNQRALTIENLPSPDKFIVVNPDQIGNFVVNYDAANWALLSQALKDKVLSAQTRAQLLYGAWSLAYAGELDFTTALDLSLSLQTETSALVWNRFFCMVNTLKKYLSATELESLFDEYVRRLEGHRVRILSSSTPGDEKTSEPRDTAENTRNSWSKHHHNSSLDQVFKAWAYSTELHEYAKMNEVPFESILRRGSLEQYQFVLSYAVKLLDSGLGDEAKDMFDILARTAPQQAEKAESLLKTLFLEDHTNMTSTVQRACICKLSGVYNGSLDVFHFVQDNWDELRRRLESSLELWKLLINAATARFVTQEDLDMFSEFYVEKRGHFGNAELLVEKELERMKEDAVWTRDNIPVIHRWLEDFLGKSVFLADSLAEPEMSG